MYIQALKILWPAVKQQKRLTLLVLGCTLALIGLSVFFSYWSKWFYNSLQMYDKNRVFILLGVFTGVACVHVLVSGMGAYWTRFLEFTLREALYSKYSMLWVDGMASRKVIDIKTKASTEYNVRNPEQRMAEDLIDFARIIISFLKAVINAAVKLPVFLYILLTVANVWVMVAGLAYAILGTICSRLVAKPLVDLEFIQQQREAQFRKNITYAVDGKIPLPTLEEIKKNWVQLAKRNKLLSFFTSGYFQIAVVLPYFMLLPLYFAKNIMLGDLFQVAGALERCLESMSVLVDSRDMVVELQMTTKRIHQIETGEPNENIQT